MRKICLLLGPLLVVTATGCGSPKPGSTPRLEQTKLHDVVSSRLARLVLDPSAGLVKKGPVVADNINYISQSLVQPTTDVPGHEDGTDQCPEEARQSGKGHTSIARTALSPGASSSTVQPISNLLTQGSPLSPVTVSHL